MKINAKRRCKGQAIVEYIIIVVVVAIAALAIMGMFSDTIRSVPRLQERPLHSELKKM